LFATPSSERPDADNLDQAGLAEALRGIHPDLATAEFHFVPADTGAAAQLAACIEKLHREQWDAVLFGGVDCLTDSKTLLTLAAQGRCRTDRYPEGTLPGEGAAYLLLQKPDKAISVRAVITGLGYGQEENHGEAADRQMTALASAIQKALGQGECTADRVETAVLPMGSGVSAALEWHQVKRKLWLTPEDINPGMEEFSPQSSIGDTGAAALPLALALGCARFEFNFPSADRVLVCEGDQGTARGAILLVKKAEAADAAPKTALQHTNPRKARV
jgi:3-oxoacyl-[acyl-carrier-protein] synthase-1